MDAFENKNQSADLSNRSSNIVHQLGLVATRVKNAIGGSASLRQFGDAILKYKNLFLKKMKKSVNKTSLKKSQQEVERVVGIAENHWLVQPNRLEHWIGFKEAELVMFKWLTQMDGVTFLRDGDHLKRELASLKNQSATVLFIPPLDEWSSKIMEELKNVDPFATGSELPMEDPQPWHLNEERQKSIFEQISQLTHLAESDPPEQWKFFIASEDNGGNCGYFTIYKGKNVMKSNLQDLPMSIEELNIQLTALTATEPVSFEENNPSFIVPDDCPGILPDLYSDSGFFFESVE